MTTLFAVADNISWLQLSVFYLVKLVVLFGHNQTNSKEMAFFSDHFLRGVLFFVVGGVSSVAILKIWENRESLLREIRRRCDSNETRQPEEHDERFDWEGKSFVSYENILSKSDRIMVISKTLSDMYNQWFLRQRWKMFPKTLKGRSSWPSSYSLVQTLSLLSFFCSFFFLIIHLILKKSFYINLYFASYYLDRGRIKKRNNYSQPRNSPYTGANSVYGCSIYCHCSDPDYIFLTFATIHRGKFSSAPTRGKTTGWSAIARVFLALLCEWDHYAVVKRASRLNGGSLFFVSESRVSCERLEDRILRHLKRFQKSY